jgi:nucleoid DNA-binding protein
MNKTELAARLVIAKGITEAQAIEMVNAVFATLVDALLEEKRVNIRGFGAFQVRERQARVGRNPNTGEPLTLPPRRTIVYSVSDVLRKMLGAYEL